MVCERPKVCALSALGLGRSVVICVNDAGSEIHLSPTDLASPLPAPSETRTVCAMQFLAKPRLGSGSHDPEMDPAIETASVMYVELWNRHDVVSAIEGRLEALAGSGIIRCD